jgi:predicted DNA-binding transcriptional regulator AlpA
MAANSIRRLKKMIKTEPYVKSRLAFMVGINSTTTIDKWIKKGQVPRIRLGAVEWALNDIDITGEKQNEPT